MNGFPDDVTGKSSPHFEQARKKIAHCRDAQHESLDLDNLQFERLPDEITGLIHLKRLSIRFNRRLSSIGELGSLLALEELDVSGCYNLTGLSALEGLVGIRKIYLSNNPRLKNLDALQHLPALEELDVSYCKNLSGLSALEGLVGIRKIDLSNNPCLKNLDALQHLPALEELDVSGCENLSGLSALEGLVGIRKIYLRNNPRLKNLDALQHLPALEELDVSYCKNLSGLSALEGLVGIRKIDLRNNPRLKNLDALQHLPALEELDVSGCYNLTGLSALEGLDSLARVYCNNCGIQAFPRFLLRVPTLCLYGNPLGDFPLELLGGSVYHNCNPAANDYFDELERGEAENTIRKWLVLGNGRTGKTTLLKALNGETPRKNEDSTHGIVIRRIEVDGIDMRFWDFGGQDLYLATHHLFMKSVDGILLCYRRDEPRRQKDGLGWEWENKSLAYWVDMVRTGSPNAWILPVEIAPSPSRQPDPWDVTKRMLDNSAALDKVSVPDIFNDEAMPEIAVEEVRLKLRKTLRKSKFPLPAAWLSVVNKLDERRKHQKLLEREQFDAEAQCLAPETLLQYLHGTGELFHHSHLFKGQIVLDQQWMLNAVYALFDRKKQWIKLIQESDGKFHAFMAKEVWPNNTEDEHKLFLSMITSCAAAFELTPDSVQFYEKVYYMPEMGRKKHPQWRNIFDNHSGDADTVEFHCSFLHWGVVNNWLACVGSIWRDEVFYYRCGAGLAIKSNLIQVDFLLGQGEFRQKGTIAVRTKGLSGQAVQDFLAPVLQSIKKTLEEAGIKDYKQTGKTERSPDKRDIPTIPAENRKKKVFVAYKEEEKEILDTVVECLKQLQRVPNALLFEYFTDEKLNNGVEWDPKLEREIRSADAVLFLVSGLFLGNDYCVKEIQVAKETREEKKKSGEYYGIHPLVLDDRCFWKEHFGDFMASPGKVETPLLYTEGQQHRDRIIKEYVQSCIDQLKQAASR